MAANPSTVGAKSKATLPAVIVAVVVLVVLMVFLYRHNFVPAEGPTPPKNPAKEADMKWMSEKAQESQGNFSSLSPADQQRVQQISNNKGQMALQYLYHSKK